MKDYIKIPYWPEEHAKQAYSDGYYIEAIQCIHGFIELQLRELVFLNRKQPGPHEHFDLAVDSMFEISLSIAVKVLFIQKVLSKDDRDDLIKFNRARNNIIHSIFSESKGEWRGVPKKQYDEGFNSGLKLMQRLSEITHQITASH